VVAWRAFRVEATTVRADSALSLDAKETRLAEISAKARPAYEETMARLTAVLTESRWPGAERFGAAIEENAWFALENAGDGQRALGVAALASRVREGRVDRGRFALLRSQTTPLQPGENNERPAMSDAYLTDIAAIGAYHARLGPLATMGEELARMKALDQFWRLDMLRIQRLSVFERNTASASLQTVMDAGEEIDRQHMARLKEMLTGRDWFDDRIDGPRATYDAWLLVQHAPDPAFQREMLARLEPLLGTGRVRKEDFALLFDRVALAENRPQRYGSQMHCDHGQLAAEAPVEDPPRLDARRATMDLMPWADYRDYMVANFMGSCPAG